MSSSRGDGEPPASPLGGGHVWPGSPVDFAPEFGLESPDLTTSRAIADFVTRFAL